MGAAEISAHPVKVGGVHAGAGATADKGTGIAPRTHRAPVHLFVIVAREAGDHGIPVHILAGLAEDESSWRPSAVGESGEAGLLQLSQATAAWCGVVDRFDATQSANCGARYLFAQFERFGSWELAIVAYKAGPETIPERIPAAAWKFAQRALLKAEAYR